MIDRRLGTIAALLLASGLIPHAEAQQAGKNEQLSCFCLFEKGLPAALREKPTHYGCHWIKIPNRDTREIKCINDANGDKYPIQFDPSKDFHNQFDEVTEGGSKCTPCLPIVKAEPGQTIPRGNEETGAVGK